MQTFQTVIPSTLAGSIPITGGYPLPSNADLYQIMRHDHPLGIDAFVSQACQLSLHVNPIQALQLLQECIKIMPPTGGNGRPVGRPVPALYL